MCEQAVEIHVPAFNSSSHLTYFGIGEDDLLWTEVEVTVKPEDEDGLILYNGEHNDGTGDFLAIFLSRGFVEVAFDNGDSVTLIK